MILKALIKKEFFELFKTKKFIILPIVFFIVAATSPIFAKLTPLIIKSMLNGIDINIEEPTFVTSYEQLMKNLNQIAYFVLIFIATNIFISDKTKGRLVLLLSKPLKRSDILFSKYISIITQLLVSVILGGIFFYIYTIVIFKKFNFNIFLILLLFYFIYGIFLITLSMFTSTISKSYMVSIMITISTFIILGALSLFDVTIMYLSPGQFSTLETTLMSNLKYNLNTETNDIIQIIITIISTIILTIILLLSSIHIFKEQEIN